MANNIVDFLIKLSTSGQASVERATAATDKLNKKADAATSMFKKLGAAMGGIFAVSKITGYVQKSAEAYKAQMSAETKLQQVMQNTMNATAGEIQSIKDLTAAQQKLGIIGDEVQLAGAQELSTYLSKKDSLESLVPVMNDMLAQQYGLNATQEQAAGIATMMGKVMDGQVGALSRYGYKFDEAQEKILKFGNEEERAAVLADVISASVGGMNKALAQTDAGRMKQLSNVMGDMQEKVGKLWMMFSSRVILGGIEAVGKAIKWVTEVYNGFIQGIRDGNPWLVGLSAILVGIGALIVGHTVKIAALKAVTIATTIATKLWTAAQWLLNAALTLNPIGLIIAAIVALIALIAYVIYKTDGWGKTWQNTMQFMTTLFDTFKAQMHLKWLQVQDFFLNGIEVIQKGWYKLQGLWDKDAANAGLAKLEEQRNERAREIAAAKGKVDDLTGQLADMKVFELSWNKDRKLSDLISKTKETLGISEPGIPGVASSGNNGGNGIPSDISKGVEAVATGGTRSTNITIDIGKLIETVNIHAQEFKDGMKNLEDGLVEAMTRALNVAQSNVR